MISCGSTAQWFALRTAIGRERLVSGLLERRGYEGFLPVYRSVRRWSQRTKELELPLFPGYLFCRFDFSNRLPILTTPGVKLIVGLGRTPSPVRDDEIDAIRTVVNCGDGPEPAPYLEIGRRVRIRSGALCGVEGILVETKNRYRLVVSVEILLRSVSVEIDRDSVTPIEEYSTSDGYAGSAGRSGVWGGGTRNVFAKPACESHLQMQTMKTFDAGAGA